jgi:hypothetical protein
MNDEEQLEILRAANHLAPNGLIERQLLRLRAQAFLKKQQKLPVQAISSSEPEGDKYGLPVIQAADLDVQTLRQVFAEYGALHVRGLLDPSGVDFMKEVIDRALAADTAACTGAPAEETFPWFEAFEKPLEHTRSHVRSTGSMLAADSPRAAFHLLNMFYDLKIDRLLMELFGERAGLSVEKTSLRRVYPWPAPSDWHQDGKFLGSTIRSVNVWLTLSDSGVDAPGLEIVPKRLNHILQTDGVEFEYTVSDAIVQRQFPGAMIRPEFKAGDALLFDHFLIHRTWSIANMTKVRYALESWFFPPSSSPAGYAALVL